MACCPRLLLPLPTSPTARPSALSVLATPGPFPKTCQKHCTSGHLHLLFSPPQPRACSPLTWTGSYPLGVSDRMAPPLSSCPRSPCLKVPVLLCRAVYLLCGPLYSLKSPAMCSCPCSPSSPHARAFSGRWGACPVPGLEWATVTAADKVTGHRFWVRHTGHAVQSCPRPVS